jgi:hypothetical protein
MLSAATPPLIVPIYPAKRAKQFLHLSVSAMVAIALIGQWFFATYVFVLYVFPIVAGNPELVNLSKPIIGYVKDDTFGNAALFFTLYPLLYSVWVASFNCCQLCLESFLLCIAGTVECS